MSTDAWQAFGIPDEAYAESADGRGQRILNISWRKLRSERKAARAGRRGDPSSTWLRSALIGLGVLAAAAAAVSFAAQYHLVFAAKGIPWVSALEAGIPDAGSMVFACLGIALALRGKRALRARGGNLACVGLSLAMNLIAAAAGWRGVAIWVMPSAVYAFASDTLIGVVRAHQLARLERADDEKTALAAVGGLILWALRLILAPASTLTGFRSWVIEAAPVAPGRTAPATAVTAPNVAALPAAPKKPGSVATSTPAPRRAATRRGESKTARFLALVQERYGDLAGIDPDKVSRISTELAPEVGLDPGAARSALRPRVIKARQEDI
ncbi:MAG TPA: hypothetical protein VHY31_07520 [Streptosporangiaceae bacterium]|jgi:hypothetical protein|nr:hypothetical protein [Streptosporangiaceae bacterium]